MKIQEHSDSNKSSLHQSKNIDNRFMKISEHFDSNKDNLLCITTETAFITTNDVNCLSNLIRCPFPLGMLSPAPF